MLRFFSKIRYQLAAQNRAAKYIRYAISEIVLVVIGILIALQVNNWNESRKNHRMEMEYMVNLKQDLQQDSVQLETLIEQLQLNVKSCTNLIHAVRNNTDISFSEFYSSVYYILFWNKFIPNQNTFNEMVSSGNLGKIGNDSLKLLLIKLDDSYKAINFSEQDMYVDYLKYYNNFQQHLNMADYIDLDIFETKRDVRVDSVLIVSNKEIIEKDMNRLMHDKVFVNGLFSLSLEDQNIIENYNVALQNIRTLLQLIDKELKN